ncbi:MAG: D-alanyl-D-alanine carboxypeptidase family protein [Clostridiales bacterium]|nr:D-alanyl-D-alanine carboxypeptidase family protein [Clostridiales bacterium]
MAKAEHANAYGKLIRILIVLFVLVVVCLAGYVMMDKSIQMQQQENELRAQEENARLQAQYQQAKAEETAKLEQGESVQWPSPKGEGTEVLDLTGYPLVNTVSVRATRQELITGGMMLLNHWHSQPADFPESELLSIVSVDKSVPVSGSDVRLFPNAINALIEMLAAAKADGLENYLIDEGYRTNDAQQEYYAKEEALYLNRYSGEALVNKVRQSVNVPGTSEYQSGFSFRVDRYLRGDAEFNDAKFQTTEHSDWLVENSWKYGFVFRFPVEGYPNATVHDKAYKTGESKKLSVYRYVGEANAAVMHEMNFCMEEYIEYLLAHPHIALYENGVLKYEVVRVEYNGSGDVQVEITRSAKDYTVSMDNMGGVIVCMSY